MPSISKRGQAMPESPIRKLVPYAEKAIANGVEVIHLNIGQPDIETPIEAREAVKSIRSKVYEYSHSAGNLSYREALANYYSNISNGIIKDNILITTGGSEALSFSFLSCLNPGDEIIIPEPFYANYNSFALASGIKVIPIPSEIESGFSLPPIEDFEAKINSKTKAILICNPGNPTGYLYQLDELQKLRNLVKKHDLFLFADEVYREFSYDGKIHHSVLNLEGIEDHVIVADSVSKRYSMCGIRIGALVSRNQSIIEAALKLAQARLSPPLLGQIAAEAALKTSPSYFQKVNQEYIERRNILIDGLNKIEGVLCPKPSGAFYAVAQLPIKDADQFCQWMLDSFNHGGRTVMMAPASGFYSDPDKGRNQVRIAYVLEKGKLQQALECLEAGIHAYQNEVES